jgi:aldehyde:ferredoxin oxidoreductase
MTLHALRISLTTGHTQHEALPLAVEQQYLGGRGAAVWLLANSVSPAIGPLSPDNLLIFSAGPLAGALPFASGGFVVTTRSPLTSTLTHGWALGGWGAALRRAGHDLLVLEGQRQEWCVVVIDGSRVEIRPAGALLGLDTAATAATLRGTLGDEFLTVCVGPAGETGVAYASVVAEGLFPAEPAGAGAVMANKRVKAIAVRGTSERRPLDAARAGTVMAAIKSRLAQSELAAGIRQYGSLLYADAAAARGAFSGRNGQDEQAPCPPQIAGAALAQRGRREPRGCAGCPLGCHSAYLRKNGAPLAFPELEALAGFGIRCGIASPDTLLIANDLCVRLGLDVTETSAALAFLMECQERGLTGGSLAWGDGEALLAAIRRLGQKHEKRDVLSLGVGEMQEVYWGSSSFAPQVKGLAMPALDPRALPGVALALATAPVGGDYRYAMLYEELLDELPAWLPSNSGQQAIRGPVPRLIWFERFAAALDAAGLCRRFALLAYQLAPTEANELLSAVLGGEFTAVDVARIGERIVTLERHLTRRYSDAPDALPMRWAPPQLGDLLAEYYRRHGWSASGDPSPTRLAELGIAPLPEA